MNCFDSSHSPFVASNVASAFVFIKTRAASAGFSAAHRMPLSVARLNFRSISGSFSSVASRAISDVE